MTDLSVLRLGDLSDLITKGTTPKTLGHSYAPSGIPFLRAENIQDRTVLINANSLFIDRETDAALFRSRIKAGDVLVSIAGTIGRVGLVPAHSPPMNCNQAVAIVRPKAQLVEGRYLVHWLTSSEGQRQMVRAKVTATISNLSLSQLAELTLTVPPLAEQRRIADILDKADAIRRKRNEAIDLTEELLRSIFMEMAGPAAHKYKAWPSVAIQDLAAKEENAMRTGPFGSDLRHSEFVDKGVAVLGIDNAVKNRFDWGEKRFVTREKYKRLKRYTVRPGDVIITIMGTTGRAAVVPEGIPLAITTKHLATVTLDQSLAEPEFVSQAIHRHPEILQQVQQANRGAIMNGLNLGLIRTLRLPLPPRHVQKAFALATFQVRSLERKLTAALTESDALFNSLVHRAFRGELTAA